MKLPGESPRCEPAWGLNWRRSAWRAKVLLDEAPGRIAWVRASLGSQLEEIGLESLETSVRYGPMPGQESGEWLPMEAVIDLKTRHQHWRNVHRSEERRV